MKETVLLGVQSVKLQPWVRFSGASDPDKLSTRLAKADTLSEPRKIWSAMASALTQLAAALPSEQMEPHLETAKGILVGPKFNLLPDQADLLVRLAARRAEQERRVLTEQEKLALDRLYQFLSPAPAPQAITTFISHRALSLKHAATPGKLLATSAPSPCLLNTLPAGEGPLNSERWRALCMKTSFWKNDEAHQAALTQWLKARSIPNAKLVAGVVLRPSHSGVSFAQREELTQRESLAILKLYESLIKPELRSNPRELRDHVNSWLGNRALRLSDPVSATRLEHRAKRRGLEPFKPAPPLIGKFESR